MFEKLKKHIPLICILFFFLFINILFVQSITSNDLFVHLRIGQDIFETKQIPSADYHSFTAFGANYISQGWLSQLILFLIYKTSGFLGLQISHSLLILGTFLLLFFCYKSKEKSLILLSLAFIAPLAIVHNEIRPYVFTWFFSALTIFLISKKYYRPIPFIFLFWVNIHAGFILALGALFFYLLIEFKKTKKIYLLIIFFLSFLATLVNPSGFKIYLYPFSINSSNTIAGVTEWQPFGIDTPYFWLYLTFVIISIILTLKTKTYKNNLIELLFIILFSLFGFISMRYPINVCILLFPFLIKNLYEYIHIKNSSLILVSCCLWLITLFFLFKTSYKLAQGIGINHNVLPVYGLDFITKNHISGNIFNDYIFGGYIIWKQPERKISIDSRMEIYQGQALKEYITVGKGLDNWTEILEKYNIECIFIRPNMGPINFILVKDPSWELVYFDNASVIYLKKGSYPNIPRLKNITPYGYRSEKEIDLSINEFQYLIQKNPYYYYAYKALIFLYAQKEDPSLTKYYLNQSYSLFPEEKNDPELSKINKLFQN